MILVYAGRRPSDDDFPAANEDFVDQQIRRLLAGLKPRLVVGSAAAGADLLVLRAAATLEIKRHVLIAGTREEFREESVADKDGEWPARFDALLDADGTVTTEVERLTDPADSYRAVNEQILATAREARATDEPVVLLAVAGLREGGVDHTQELVAAHEAAAGLVLRLDPRVSRDDTPRAFVAMPFGVKELSERGWKHFDADQTWDRILVPLLIDAGYQPIRADTEALLEIIDATMLREINTVPLLVADLTTQNPNVMWELGVRHTWRRSGTLLLRLEDERIPFDVQRVKVHSYARDESSVSDADCIAAITSLKEAVAAVHEGRVDSPVFNQLPDLGELQVPEGPIPRAQELATELLEQVAVASDLQRVDELLALAERVRGEADLEERSRFAVLEQIGFALIPLNRQQDAAEVLAAVAEADAKFERPRLQQQYAHALIRSPVEEGRDERLKEAEQRLDALRKRHPPNSETLGLLGSAARARVEEAVRTGEDPLPHASRAVEAYLSGFQQDPGDYYPGINTVALLRLRGQRWDPNDGDVERAIELVPVVRFAVERNLVPGAPLGRWDRITLAELELHAHLLTDDEAALGAARTHYEEARVALDPGGRASHVRQLRLFLDAGDPDDPVREFLELLEAG